MFKIGRYEPYVDGSFKHYCSLEHLCETNDSVWIAMRSLKEHEYLMRNFPNIKYVPELSPSYNLFMEYRYLKKQNNWNTDSFTNIYVPQFLHEMTNMRDMLNHLYRQSMNQNIVLLCACSNESLCHRSIIMGLMQGAEKTLNHHITICNTDYSKYYDMYCNMK